MGVQNTVLKNTKLECKLGDSRQIQDLSFDTTKDTTQYYY